MNDTFKKLLIKSDSFNNHRNTSSVKQSLKRMDTGVHFSKILKDKAEHKTLSMTMNNFNLNNDNKEQIFALQDQLVQFKTYFNQKEKEFHSMKINHLKLEEENKKNLKIIQKILGNVNLNRQVEEHPDDKKLIGDIDTLKETFVISSLKYEISKLKKDLYEKDKEIEELKKQDKISRYISIKTEYKKMCDDYKLLHFNFTELKQKYEQVEINNKQLKDDNQNLTKNLSRIRSLYEELQKMLKFHQEESSVNYYEKKEMKDKLFFTKYSQKYLQNKIKQMEDEKMRIIKSNEEIDEFYTKRKDYEKTISELNKKVNFALFEKEQLNKKIKQKEKDEDLARLFTNRKMTKAQSKSNLRKLTTKSIHENEDMLSKISGIN